MTRDAQAKLAWWIAISAFFAGANFIFALQGKTLNVIGLVAITVSTVTLINKASR